MDLADSPIPATSDAKKDESKNRPRISLYRWLGQRQDEEQRRVTFKTDERSDKDGVQTRESKEEGIEVVISNTLNPHVSNDEMREYERYYYSKIRLTAGILRMRRH